MSTPEEIGLSKDEVEQLEEAHKTWATKSRAEKNAAREILITKFLQGRQHNVADPYARGLLKTVRISEFVISALP